MKACLEIKADGREFLKLSAILNNAGKQARFAASRALNDAAYAAKMEAGREMGQVFDSPTKWLTSQIEYRKSTKDNLTARVGFDLYGNKQGVTASHVLAAQIEGGNRALKRHEKALQRLGYLPAGHAIVPGAGADIDVFGNMRGGQIVQILSYFQAFGMSGHTANMTETTRRKRWQGTKKTRGFAYFCLQKPHGKLKPGIYKRTNFGRLCSAVIPVMFFIRPPVYSRRYDFYKVAGETAEKTFDKLYPQYLDEALRTAK